MKNDRAYFLNRAETQVALARRATCEAAARAHYHIAGFYWDRAYNDPASCSVERARLASHA